MQMTTVFDGILPASPNPGIDPGAAVVVWTPVEKKGQFQVVISAPDEPGAPFSSADGFIVDSIDGAGIINGGLGNGTFAGEFQEVEDYPNASLRLATSLDHAVRVVVQVGLVAAPGMAATGETSIVPLDVLKRALDIEADDDSFDQILVDLETRAAAYVERMTSRRWSEPDDSLRVIPGRGSRILWLPGHVDGPDPVVAVRERAIYGGVYEVVDPADYEVREGESLVRLDGSPWSKYAEYEVAFIDGYPMGQAPQDIQDLVIDLVSISYSGFVDDGVKQESIGDYSYTLDASVATAASSMSNTSTDPMNRRRPLHV